MDHAEPPGLDVDRPSEARIYDYLLGGSLNFAADRAAARDLIAAVPGAPLVAQANRAFLRRAVRFLCDAGVRQFLDIGAGVPTRGNVHEIARQAAPGCRVVYVDIDPVAVAHGRDLLAGDDLTAAVLGDARKVQDILDHPDVRRLLDFDEPVAALLVALLHLVPDSDEPAQITRELGDALCPGSYLTISHLSRLTGSGADGQATVYQPPAVPVWPRGQPEITALFGAFELIEPGLVPADRWRPEPPDGTGLADYNGASLLMYTGVARKG